jgi:hypothetical protein
LLAWPSSACTIFVLVDAERALFFNNEDFSNPRTRIWFVPAGKDFLGCAYLGFDDGWAQGGLNSEGLAFDWVAGFEEKWEPGRNLKRVRGNSSQRMLESCRTVDEAIEFYKTHLEADFHRSKILIADRSGASVIIGAHDGKLQLQRETHCRGFGYGAEALRKMLTPKSEASVENGVKILRAALQNGQFGTKYSNIFDLKSGDIFLFQLAERNHSVKLNLSAELAKGPHYYDLSEIEAQYEAAPKPLMNNMKRFLMDEFKPVPDANPKTTVRLSKIMRDAVNGSMREEDYSPQLWKELSKEQEKIQADLKKLGKFKSLTLVERRPSDRQQTLRYRVNFSKATVLQTFTMDQSNRVIGSELETVEFQPLSN